MTSRQSPARLTSRQALAAVGLTAVVLLLGFAESAAAATITVDPTAVPTADGKCSLQEAIEAANTDAAVDACPAGDGDDVIDFDGIGTISAPEGGFQITSNMTIQGFSAGPGDVGTTIVGADGFDIILTDDTSSSAVTAVTLADLELRNDPLAGERRGDKTGEGGYGVHVKDESGATVDTDFTVTLEFLRVEDYWNGIRVDKAVDSGRTGDVIVRSSVIDRESGQGASVYLDACDMVAPFYEVALTVSNSFVDTISSAPGAGVHNDCGHLKIVSSTIAGNRDGVSASGGRLGEGDSEGKVASTRTEIINSTVADNFGVGVSVWKDSSSLMPELSIINSTITDNNGVDEMEVGGIFTSWEGTGEHAGEYFDVEVHNSVVAGNTGRQCELAGTLAEGSKSGNASSDDSCGFGLVRGDFGLAGLWPDWDGVEIGPNGGSSLWMRALNRNSPLIDAVSGSHCPHEKARTDARSVSRPQGSACDIGAYEAEYGTLGGRVSGVDRYWTAAAVSRETFAPSAGTVYVATGANFPDALAGAAASGGAGPILLVTKDSIPAATLTELKRLTAKRIVVLGGPGVISDAVEEELSEEAYWETTRQAGSDRYSTAAAVSAAHFDPGAAVAFVATGENYPDALAGGPPAAKLGGPILLTEKDKLPAATITELNRLKPGRIVVLGGTGVVSAAVEKALQAHTSGEVSRLAGADRYSTAAAVSAAHFDPGAAVAFVATGLDSPDALAGSAALGGSGPILLTTTGSIPSATLAELRRLKPKQVVVLGGTSVVSKDVEDALAALTAKLP